MSLHNLSYVCSHLKNCSMARVPITSIQYTKLHLGVVLGLYRHGAISHVQLGSRKGPDTEPIQVTSENISTRRLWVTLKYYNAEPVLKNALLESKPSKKKTMKLPGLKRLIEGYWAENTKPLDPGDLLFLRTDKGILEAREAVELQRGGQLLCRFTSLR
ncbi:ribosomal protein S8 [Lipomyces doorenjongii]|uniref:mitochondrial 37S ribosomal protein uS8m n=1 Tax=Lipomyces doorenjongii TaxID=383834 RepID=UPI003343FC56